MGKDSLVVSSGALFIASKVPCGCNLRRNLNNDSVWVPKLLVAVPDEKSPFVVNDCSITKQGIPYTVPRDNGGSVWHANKEVQKTLNLVGYVFLPGELRSESIKSLYNLENSFVPDERDINQERLGVNVVSDNSFDYSERGYHRNFTANVLGNDLFGAISLCLSNSFTSSFGYSCEFSGDVGLSAQMTGGLEISLEQRGELMKVIKGDLEKKLPSLFSARL